MIVYRHSWFKEVTLFGATGLVRLQIDYMDRTDSLGSFSIYDTPQFEDENFQVKHTVPGLLSMVSS